MTLRRAIIGALDRPGGRTLLAGLTTWYARRKTGQDVGVSFDEYWIHRVGADCIVDGTRFRYDRGSPAKWASALQAMVEFTHDWCFHAYKPKPGDVIVDVGAGVGWETFVFARSVGPQGRVLAIEAHPKTFRRLEKLCTWNKLDNTECVQCAVTDRPRTVYIEDQDVSEDNAVALVRDGTHLDEDVAGLPLDEVCRAKGIERINFLKMNIEGAERLAIQGMDRMIRRTEHVCIACHDFRAERGDGEHLRTREEIVEFLRRNEFDVVLRDADPRPFVRDHIHGKRQA